MDRDEDKLAKPHDRFFRGMLENKKTAQEFLQQYLPEELSAIIEWGTLEAQPDTFIKTDLTNKEVDILHKVKTTDGDHCYLYTLLEHQSTPDKIMSLRIWKYILEIMEKYMQIKDKQPFPYVYAMIVYNGSEKYNYSTYLKDLIKGPARQVDNLFYQGFTLLDLYRTDDKEFTQFLRSGLLCRFMKHIHDSDILPFLQEVLLDVRELLTTELFDDSKIVGIMLHYVIKRGQISDKNAFGDLIMNNLNESGEKILMTYAEFCKQEGRQEGCQEGKQEILSILRRKYTPVAIAEMINQPLETVLKMLGECEF